jgi:hypothetical protein
MTTAGTDVFPTLAVGDPGKVDVGWLNSTSIVPTDANGKFLVGGCSGSTTPPVQNPPPACPWNLMQGQSLDFNLGSAAGTWTTSQLTAAPMHVGDVCNLGISCLAGGRNLLDFNQETVDPTTGCAHMSFADDNTVNMLRAANQITGPAIIGAGSCAAFVANTPESPLTVLLIPVGAAAAVVAGVALRRRRKGEVAL